MRGVLLLGLFLLAQLVSSSAERRKCYSGLKGDFQYEACGSFCKMTQANKHCNFCKCKECSYCQGLNSGNRSFAQPKKLADASKQRQHVDHEASKLVEKYQRGAPVATEAAEAGTPAATDGSVASLAPSADGSPPSGHAYIFGGSIAGLLCVCYVIAIRQAQIREESAKWSPVDGDAETGEEGGTPRPPPSLANELLLVTAESRTRALCVSFLCVQYSAYALLRRYATRILMSPPPYHP